jgi:hypothetical protein
MQPAAWRMRHTEAFKLVYHASVTLWNNVHRLGMVNVICVSDVQHVTWVSYLCGISIATTGNTRELTHVISLVVGSSSNTTHTCWGIQHWTIPQVRVESKQHHST